MRLLLALVVAVAVLAIPTSWVLSAVTAEAPCESDWFQAPSGAWLCDSWVV
jgi:hypothetical protein